MLVYTYACVHSNTGIICVSEASRYLNLLICLNGGRLSYSANSREMDTAVACM